MLSQNTTDEELWEAIRKDEVPAFKALYERYWSSIFSTAWSHLHDRAACTEIVQDIFLSIWLKRRQLKMNSPYHYLTMAARYQVYKRLRQKGNQKIIYTDSLQETSTVSHTLNEGEYDLRYAELQVSVDKYLKELPDRCQEIFNLSRKEQLSIAEIAERLGISRRTVENQLTRALQHLRNSLGDLYMAAIIAGYLFF